MVSIKNVFCLYTTPATLQRRLDFQFSSMLFSIPKKRKINVVGLILNDQNRVRKYILNNCSSFPISINNEFNFGDNSSSFSIFINNEFNFGDNCSSFSILINNESNFVNNCSSFSIFINNE